MRETRTEPAAVDPLHAADVDIDAGTEQKTQFTAHGTIPPVGKQPEPEAAAPEGASASASASASDLAFGGGSSGRAAAGAGSGSGSGGKPLPDDLRKKFEQSLGMDLSDVRIHTDTPDAKAAGAKAIAHGKDIHLAPGQYDPSSTAGQELLAHEVAHTVQQQDAVPRPQAKTDRPAPADSPAEHDADQAAAAMTSGGAAAVSPVAIQAPHAKEYSRAELMTAYSGSLARGDWSDVALRLNGFSDDDIALLVGKLSFGQKTHVREAAETAMPGWSQRVTSAIDSADSNAAKVASLYAAYEKAVAGAKASGDWHEVVDRLNGMGDWDIQDRLAKLTWFDYEAMRGQTTNARVLAAIDKADTARVNRVNAAYDAAIKAQDWKRAAAQLHGMDDDGIRTRMDALAAKPETVVFLKRIKEAAPTDTRLVTIIDEVAKANGTVVPDPLVVQPIVEMPAIADNRPLSQCDMANFGGNAAIAKFAAELEASYTARREQSKRTDDNRTQAAIAANHFAVSFQTTGDHYKKAQPDKTFGTFAKQWMSEMRERADLDSGDKLDWAKLPSGIGKQPLDKSQLVPLIRGASGGQLVHPYINDFITKLGSGFNPSTYVNHGGSPEMAPYCLDVDPAIAHDARGLYQPDQMVEFIEKINATAGSGNWSGVYNDTTVLRELQKRGLGNKVDTQAKDGSNNFHGALNLHIHLYLRPPEGWAPADPSAAPKVDPQGEPH